MADNYLENKMEQHLRSSSGQAVKRVRSTYRPGPHELVLEFPQLRVLVIDGAEGRGRDIVAAYRSIGALVDFTGIDRHAGAATAQATGARFLPVTGDDDSLLSMAHRSVTDRGGLDVVIGNLPDTVTFQETIRRFDPKSLTPLQMLLLSHPAMNTIG